MKVHVRGIRLVAAAVLSLSVGACGAGEGGSDGLELGLKVSDEGTAQGVGLPAYPGSKPYKDNDDSNAADVGISTPWLGLKVVAVELETRDEPEKVTAFYRKALAKYGEVLECSGNGETEASDSRDDTDELTCDYDDPGSHGIVYKVGTKNNQRIVALKPHGSGTQYSLVYLNIRDDD